MRGIIAGNNMRAAVLKHPRRAGAFADHLMELLQINSDLGTQCHGLGGRGNMHTRQQLIDHFHL